ncbi:MAG: pilus assembly FimT family protein [Planctomycetaceae bacterium]
MICYSPQDVRSRRGDTRLAFTLVELLVALTIALVLTAVALPRVKEGLKQNVSTRTASLVKSTFENARAQAIRTGRPFGVVLHRSRNEVTATDNPFSDPLHGSNYCNRLSFAQVAFEYRGDVEGTVALYPGVGAQPFIVVQQATAGLIFALASGTIQADANPPMDVGCLVGFGDSDNCFVISRRVFPSPGPPFQLTTAYDVDGDGATDDGVIIWLQPRWPVNSAATNFAAGHRDRYRISTLPVASPMAELPLPGKTIMDLTCSGVGSAVSMFSPRAISDGDGFTGTATIDAPYLPYNAAVPPATLPTGYRDPIVMFTGNGQLDGVYIEVYTPNSGPDSSTESDDYFFTKVLPPGPLSLLLGEVDGVARPETVALHPTRLVPTAAIDDSYLPADSTVPNFANLNGAWVTVSPMSGSVRLDIVGSPVPDLAARHPELLPAPPNTVFANALRARLFDSRRLARGTVQ